MVNVATGPGSTYMPGDDDVNCIAGWIKVKLLPKRKTLGYIRTAYASIPMDEIVRILTAWANSASYSASHISIHGLFIDEFKQLGVYNKRYFPLRIKLLAVRYYYFLPLWRSGPC